MALLKFQIYLILTQIYFNQVNFENKIVKELKFKIKYLHTRGGNCFDQIQWEACYTQKKFSFENTRGRK